MVRAEHLLTIGEVGARVGLATSAIRYYERRGLLQADARVSGQRRYREETLRRLVFIGMLQDAGLDLDEIDGVLHAARRRRWKAIARRRLAALDEEIERLQQARAYLDGALLCRYDHPATDCRIMGAEIDRRLAGADHPNWQDACRGRKIHGAGRRRERSGRGSAGFWSSVLGWTRSSADDDGVVELVDPSGQGPSLVFAPVPEPKVVKNRVHIDVNPVGCDQQEELARLLSLGARKVDIGQGEQRWIVLADPEGNEFCLLATRHD